MLNIVLTVKDRPRLTHQCLTSLIKHTDVDYNVTVVDDCSAPETRDMLRLFAKQPQVALLRNERSKGIVGQAKNLGVYWAEKYWGRGDWLYLSDNDVWFSEEWASKLTTAIGLVEDKVTLLGGQNHPYHQPIEILAGPAGAYPGCLDGHFIREYCAVAGTSWLMRWKAWDLFGPLDATTPGVCKSEDHNFCQKIRDRLGKVAAVYPPLVFDCSLQDSEGKPAIGWQLKDVVPGVIYE